MSNQVSVDDIVELVGEVLKEDPIDWGMLPLDEDIATELIVNQLVDRYNTEWITFGEEDKNKILLASMAKLILENFVLNLKLRQ